MIKLTNLSFGYSSGAPLFSDADLSLPEPGFYAIFGKSGSGKSTLGKIIAGLLKPTELSSRQVSGTTLFASCDDALPGWTPVGKHITAFTPEDSWNLLTEFKEAAELPDDLWARFPNELSHGQKQRFNLARFALQRPQCLILDEPLAGVDQPGRWRILEWLKKCRREQTTILISHELDDVALFSKTIVKLSWDRPARLSLLTGLDRLGVSTGADVSLHDGIRSALLAA